jgi:hypothetical protein
MARSTLSALVALVSLTLVAGQSTTTAAANGVPTFPTTPLVSELFPYTALVRILFPDNQTFSLLKFFTFSLNKFIPIKLSAGHKLATIGAIQLRRTKTHCARPYLSITSLVPYLQNVLIIRD